MSKAMTRQIPLEEHLLDSKRSCASLEVATRKDWEDMFERMRRKKISSSHLDKLVEQTITDL